MEEKTQIISFEKLLELIDQKTLTKPSTEANWQSSIFWAQIHSSKVFKRDLSPSEINSIKKMFAETKVDQTTLFLTCIGLGLEYIRRLENYGLINLEQICVDLSTQYSPLPIDDDFYLQKWIQPEFIRAKFGDWNNEIFLYNITCHRGYGYVKLPFLSVFFRRYALGVNILESYDENISSLKFLMLRNLLSKQDVKMIVYNIIQNQLLKLEKYWDISNWAETNWDLYLKFLIVEYPLSYRDFEENKEHSKFLKSEYFDLFYQLRENKKFFDKEIRGQFLSYDIYTVFTSYISWYDSTKLDIELFESRNLNIENTRKS